MSHYWALLSIIFMMSFVLIFDRVHAVKRNIRFIRRCLMNDGDVNRLRLILAACQED